MESSVGCSSNVEKNLFYIFIIFCLFPYVNILHINTDAQPNALVLAIVIFLVGLRKYKYPKTAFLILFLMIPFYIVGSIIGNKYDFWFFRSLIGYLSLFFITLMGYISLKKGYVISWYWFKNFIFLNIIISLLQIIFKFNFVGFLFYRVSTSDTRGVTGLTPEPTFNATIAIFCASLYLLNYYKKERNYILVLILVWIIILAQSSTILLTVFPVVLIYLIFNNFKTFILPVILIITLVFCFLKQEEDSPESSRLLTVISIVAYNPSKLLTLDESVNSRVSNIIVPAYLSITDFMIPHGSNMDFLNNSIPIVTKETFPNLFFFISSKVEKIMSGWSLMFYEVGVIGFILFLYILYLIIFELDNLGMEFLGALIFIIVLFTAVTINTSIIPFIFGNIIYKAKNRNKLIE